MPNVREVTDEPMKTIDFDEDLWENDGGAMVIQIAAEGNWIYALSDTGELWVRAVSSTLDSWQRIPGPYDG